MSADPFGMTATAHRTLGVVLAVLAVYYAVRAPSVRPIAALACGQAVINIVRPVLRLGFGLDRALGLPPFQGAQRAVYFIDSALFAAWAPALAAVALVVLGHDARPGEERPRARRALPALIIWIAIVAVVCAGYPGIRGAALTPVYLVGELASLALAATAFPALWRNRGRLSIAQGVVLALVLVQGVSVFLGPLRFGLFDTWGLSLAADMVLYSFAALVIGGALWMRE